MIPRKRTSTGSSQTRPARRRRTTAPRRMTVMRTAYTPTLATTSRRSLQEVKCFDVNTQMPLSIGIPTYSSASGAEPSSAWQGYTCINEVTQGAAVYQRIGNKVVFRSIHARFCIYMLTGTIGAAIRIALIYDRQPNGAYPAGAEMFQTTLTTMPRYSPLNIGNKSRFSIIRDQVVDLSVQSNYSKSIQIYAKGRWETEYAGVGTGTIGDIKTGAIYLYIVEPWATGGHCDLSSGTVRLRYYD